MYDFEKTNIKVTSSSLPSYYTGSGTYNVKPQLNNVINKLLEWLILVSAFMKCKVVSIILILSVLLWTFSSRHVFDIVHDWKHTIPSYLARLKKIKLTC